MIVVEGARGTTADPPGVGNLALVANAGGEPGTDPIARAFEHLVQEEPIAPPRPSRSNPSRARPQEPDKGGTAALEQLARRIDRLADVVAALPQRSESAHAVGELSDEMKAELSGFRLQVQADLAKVAQRVASETTTLRSELQAALAMATEVPADQDQREAAVAATSERIRSLLAEERKAFRGHLDAALAEQTERMQSTLAEERRAVRSELQTALGRLADQAAEERKERRGELHAAVVNSSERLRSVLVDERKELRGELQIVLPDVLRHRAEEWQQLRAALDASLNQNSEAALVALSQLGQQLGEMRRELVATIAKANDRRVEDREQLLAEFQSALATNGQQVADEQRRLRGVLDTSLAEGKKERQALEAAVRQTGERTGDLLAELSQRLVEMRREVTGAIGQLAAQQAEEEAQRTAQLTGAIGQLAGQRAQEEAQRTAQLTGAIGQLAAQQAEEDAQRTARAAEEATQLRADFRTGLVNSHNQLVSQQLELHRALEANLAREREARLADGLRQGDELRSAVEEVRTMLAEDRRELRALVAATVEAANQWFTQLRDQLYERLETVVDVTAQSSASAAAAVKALRKDIKAVEADPRLLEALAQLSDEIERLERRIPSRVALRLPDSQLNAIVEAVRAPAGRSASGAARSGAGAAKKADKKASPRAARRVAPVEPAASDPDVRAW